MEGKCKECGAPILAEGPDLCAQCDFKDIEIGSRIKKLNSTTVNNIFLDCLFRQGEDHTNHIRVTGIASDFGFHPERLESHRQEVVELLDELPDQFHEKTGGGWTFLNGCVDKDGDLWGQHLSVEQLFCLGVGLGIVKECLPVEMRITLPGGVPYYMILSKE